MLYKLNIFISGITVGMALALIVFALSSCATIGVNVKCEKVSPTGQCISYIAPIDRIGR
jgi:hypothetical protein